MNIYEKLNAARLRFQEKNVKMTGENRGITRNGANARYYELSDILPVLTPICIELGICNLENFGEEATLTLVNTEKTDEFIVFHSPMSTADLKNCHPVQSLGAVQTYLRRYLYQNAYSIAESDALDGADAKKDDPAQALKEKKMTDEDFRTMAWDMLLASAMPDDKKDAWMKAFQTLTMPKIHNLIDMLAGAKK